MILQDGNKAVYPLAKDCISGVRDPCWLNLPSVQSVGLCVQSLANVAPNCKNKLCIIALALEVSSSLYNVKEDTWFLSYFLFFRIFSHFYVGSMCLMRHLHLARSWASSIDNSLRQVVPDAIQPPPLSSSSPSFPPAPPSPSLSCLRIRLLFAIHAHTTSTYFPDFFLTSNFDFCPTVYLVRFCHQIVQLRYADKRFVNIMKVYIERNNLQLELIRYCKHFDFIHVYFCEAMDSMQYRPPNAYREVSNINHFWPVYDSLGRLVATSECIASRYIQWSYQ